MRDSRLLLALSIVGISTATAPAREPWVTLLDCHYVANDANDGDSFHVRSGNKKYLFRLYFVDAPETELEFGDRVNEQMKYFGTTTPQTLQIGEAARNFVRAKLSHSFIVRTCLQDALGRSKMERFYAFVEVDHRDLGEELVANGLARLHGTDSRPPGMNSVEVEWQKLEQLERTAKQQKVGAWGVSVGRLNTRVETKEQYTANSFDAFFHPERLRATPTPTAAFSPTLSARSASVSKNTANPSASPEAAAQKKLDVNAASEQELNALPGIGSVLVGRIVAARPFKSADDLRRVKGIGKKKYETIRPFFD
jgi:DNA uptake protein ComE-like DNA-binding protein